LQIVLHGLALADKRLYHHCCSASLLTGSAATVKANLLK